MPMDWNADVIAAMKMMLAEGLPYSTIGARLGCSRNAVLGKAHRMGVSPARTSTHNRARRTAPKVRRRKLSPAASPRRLPSQPSSPFQKMLAAGIEPQPPYVEPPADAPLPGGKMLVDLDAQDCRWPHGDPRHEHFRFCARTTVEGLSYCATHARLAYRLAEAPRKPTGGQTSLAAVGVADGLSNQAQMRPEPRETLSEKESAG